MDICSPENAFVTDLLVQDGASVTSGTLLLRMDTDREDKQAQRLSTMQAVRDVTARKYSGEQLDAQRKLAQVTVDLTQSVYHTLYAIYLEFASERQQTGTADPFQVQERLGSAQSAQLDWEKAKAQQQRLEFSVANWLATDEIVKAHLDSEQKYVKAMKARMQISAPIAGKVALKVAVGSFVKRGHVILAINT